MYHIAMCDVIFLLSSLYHAHKLVKTGVNHTSITVCILCIELWYVTIRLSSNKTYKQLL